MALKILYAASNSVGSKTRLRRFLNAIKNKNYIIKIAAYIKSSPSISIDWTLNSLLDIYNQKKILFNNDNLRIYYDQIKYFNPDLIISDAEPFTSYIANILNIKIWQVSPLLLNGALPYNIKYNIGTMKHYYHLFKSESLSDKSIESVINNSNRKLVYSHFGDLNLSLNQGYEWIRPYHVIGKSSKASEHNIVGISPNSNYNIINYINKYNDSILFTSQYENYKNINIKNINDVSEYISNLKNCIHFINEGHGCFMADAFYNNKFSIILPDYKDPECIINSVISEHLKLSKIINKSSKLIEGINAPIYNYKEGINYLHEEIEKL